MCKWSFFYVTEHSIQKHYPSYSILHGENMEHFHSHYSTITLADNAFTGPRDYSNNIELKIVL